MRDKKPDPHLTPAALAAAERRKDRSAAALRANLRRRKAQLQHRHKRFNTDQGEAEKGR